MHTSNLQSIILDNDDQSDIDSYQSNTKIRYSYPFPSDKRDNVSGESYTQLHIQIFSPDDLPQGSRYYPSSPIVEADKFGEKTTGYPAWKNSYSQAQISNMFQIIDADKDGFIGEHDIQLFLDLIGESYSKEEVKEMIAMLDPQQGTAAQFQQFNQLLYNSAQISQQTSPILSSVKPQPARNSNTKTNNASVITPHGRISGMSLASSKPLSTGSSPTTNSLPNNRSKKEEEPNDTPFAPGSAFSNYKRIDMSDFNRLFTQQCYIGLSRSYNRSPREFQKYQIYEQLNKKGIDLTDEYAGESFINCVNQCLNTIKNNANYLSSATSADNQSSTDNNRMRVSPNNSIILGNKPTTQNQRITSIVTPPSSFSSYSKPQEISVSPDNHYTNLQKQHLLTRPKYSQAEHQCRKQLFQSTIHASNLNSIFNNYHSTDQYLLSRKEIAQLLIISEPEAKKLYEEFSQQRIHAKLVMLELIAYSSMPKIQRIQQALAVYNASPDIDFEQIVNLFGLIGAHDERLRSKLETVFKKKELNKKGRIDKEMVVQIIAEYGPVFSI